MDRLTNVHRLAALLVGVGLLTFFGSDMAFFKGGRTGPEWAFHNTWNPIGVTVGAILMAAYFATKPRA